MSLLTGKPRSATVTTVQPTTVFTLTRADFRNLLTQHPEISLGLARILAERLEDSHQAGRHRTTSACSEGEFRSCALSDLLPQSLILLHKVVPVAYVNNSVTLAMVNPSNLVAFDDVRRYIKGVDHRAAGLYGRRFPEVHGNASTGSSWALERRQEGDSTRE